MYVYIFTIIITFLIHNFISSSSYYDNDDNKNDNNDHNNNDNENLRGAVETARPIFLLDRLKRRGYRDVRRGKVDPE